MKLKNLPQHQENWEEPFGTQAGSRNSYLHWDGFSEPKAANRSSVLNEGRRAYSSVSFDPPPSFLTEVPLGTFCKEAAEVKPDAKACGKWEQSGGDSSVFLQSEAVEQGIKGPKKFRQKIRQQRKPTKSNQRTHTYGFIYRWIYEEVRISMSKMSIASLVLGLLFLGTLFFIIGFLAAVSTIGSSTN